MSCRNCKARTHCSICVGEGSIACFLTSMLYGGTHGDYDAESGDTRPTYCAYCGRPLKIVENERFCDNANCLNRYQFI